jgi:hypothetical protein
MFLSFAKVLKDRYMSKIAAPAIILKIERPFRSIKEK